MVQHKNHKKPHYLLLCLPKEGPESKQESKKQARKKEAARAGSPLRQPRERARARVPQDSRKETKSCGMIFAFFVTYSHIVTPFITQRYIHTHGKKRCHSDLASCLLRKLHIINLRLYVSSRQGREPKSLYFNEELALFCDAQ